MDVTVKGSPKEIADLVLQLQSQQKRNEKCIQPKQIFKTTLAEVIDEEVKQCRMKKHPKRMI